MLKSVINTAAHRILVRLAIAAFTGFAALLAALVAVVLGAV